MPRLTELDAFLTALKEPVVTWDKPAPVEEDVESGIAADPNATTPVKVFAPGIDLDAFEVEIDEAATDAPMTVYACSPRLIFSSVGLDADSKKADFELFDELRSDAQTMAKYASGRTYTQKETEDRFAALFNRFATNNPYSLYKVECRYTDHPIAMGNYGFSDKVPNFTEFAFIGLKSTWSVPGRDNTRRHYATEVGIMGLYKLPEKLRADGYKLNGVELGGVRCTARGDNGSAYALEKLGIPVVGTDTPYGDQPDQLRKVYQASISELNDVVENTRQQRATLRV